MIFIMIQRTQKILLFFLPLALSAMSLLAQADQESPFQSNETVTKGNEGLGSSIWIIVGIVVLLGIFLLLRKGGSGATRAGNPK